VPVSLPEDPEPLGGIEEDLRDGVETTVDEMEGFHIVRAIAVSEIPVSRITFRDTKSYFGVLIDDNNRKPVCRLHFNRRQRYIGLLDENKVESRVPVDRIEDIYDHAEAIRAAVKRYR
jgi:hypothetical protein